MKTFYQNFSNLVAYFFILLFIYASINKILDFENFQVQLAQSPLLSAYAGVISYTIILIEIVIAILISIPKCRLLGMHFSFCLMVVFSVYIYLILNYGEFIPCSCGGILENMGWNAHLIFNIFCVSIAGITVIVDTDFQKKQLKKRLFKLSGLFLGCIVLMISLFVTSEYMIKKENNFTRRFLQNPLSKEKSFSLDEDRYYFAGVSQNRIYLGNSNKPLLLSSLDSNLNDFQQVKVVPENSSSINFRHLRIQVKGNDFYLSDGSVPIIYIGRLAQNRAKIISKNDVFFTEMQVMDSLHFVMRSQSSTSHQYILASLNLEHKRLVKIEENALEKQIDGVFDVDGILKTDNDLVVYMYYYRNQFLILNDKLKLLRKLNTIDDTKKAQISVTEMQNGSRRMDAPPMKVNKKVALYNGLVFNVSSLRGKFEPYNEWKRRNTIDIYRSDNQYYVGSFRLKKIKDEDLEDLLINGSSLYVLQGHELIKYPYNKSLRNIIEQGEAENLKKSR